MFIVLKIEVKINYNSTLQYIQDNIIGKTPTLKEANTIMNADIDERTNEGYFDKILCRRDNYAMVTNGGTAYLKYQILEV